MRNDDQVRQLGVEELLAVDDPLVQHPAQEPAFLEPAPSHGQEKLRRMRKETCQNSSSRLDCAQEWPEAPAIPRYRPARLEIIPAQTVRPMKAQFAEIEQSAGRVASTSRHDWLFLPLAACGAAFAAGVGLLRSQRAETSAPAMNLRAHSRAPTKPASRSAARRMPEDPRKQADCERLRRPAEDGYGPEGRGGQDDQGHAFSGVIRKAGEI